MGYTPQYSGAVNFATPTDNSYYQTLPPYTSDARIYMSDLGDDLFDSSVPQDGIYHNIWTNGNYSIQLMRTGISTDLRLIEISSNISASLCSPQNQYCNHIYVSIGYDESLQTYAFYSVTGANVNGSQYWDGQGNGQYQSEPSAMFTRFFADTPIISYNWQSVPSISGKNGILSLVTLDSESINDGEPVSGAAVSVFDQAPSDDNNIKNLADTYGSGEESSAVDVTVKYKVTLPPSGAFDVLKLVAKKGSIPEDAFDGDKIVDISPTKTKKTVTGLDENSTYYFKIFAEDTNNNTSESDEKHITTSTDEGWLFDYTGEIVEWTVPKTGYYSLETWGAQGGEATDGTNSARGGYGAYAYGEVLLTQGEKLYINVGGQNGYGGGGNYVAPNS